MTSFSIKKKKIQNNFFNNEKICSLGHTNFDSVVFVIWSQLPKSSLSLALRKKQSFSQMIRYNQSNI